MRGRQAIGMLAYSPTMVGAVTVLITVVAVFLAFNANKGLPFVPVYRVSIDVPNAARLLDAGEVRIGGRLVGAVESVELAESDDPGTSPAARLNLKLGKEVQPLPQDSVFRVRYRSGFGLKYIEIGRGDGPPAPEGFVFDGTDDGRIASISEAGGGESAENGVFVQQTESDDIANTFDIPTRMAVRTNLLELGNAFTGRGASLGEAVRVADPLLRDVRPVAGDLAAPQTRLGRLIDELADAARIIEPVAPEQAELFTNGADAFAALSADPEALADSISGAPPALEAGVETLPAQVAFLSDTAELARRLRPGVGELRVALPSLDDAIATGTPVLARTPALSAELDGVFAELEELVDSPETGPALSRLESLVDTAAPLVTYVAPAQTVCNFGTYFFTFIPGALTDRDQVGYNLRNNIIFYPQGPMGIGTGLPAPLDRIVLPGEVETPLASYSGLQANGKAGEADAQPGVFKPYELPILHGNPYGPTGQDGDDCQPGQFGYTLGQARVPGQPSSNPAFGINDIPGSRGPTTLYFNQDGSKELRDTRVAGRQP